MTTTTSAELPVGYECRFAVYCPPPQGEQDDYHLVKERQHMPDGTTRPGIRLLKNYRRSFWVTKKGMRNHQDKKEWEHLDRVEEFKCTQSQLAQSVAKALGMPWFNTSTRDALRKLSANPYLYGSDILSTAVVKQMWMDNFPQLNTKYSMAVFDIETDVVRGTQDIIMATVSMGERVYTAVQAVHVQGHANVVPRLQELLTKYLSSMEREDKKGNVTVVNVLEKRGIKWEVEIVNSDAEVVTRCFERAHQWQPDFLAIWNIDFDIPKVAATLEKHGIRAADVFSDPRVPKRYRFFEYKQGPKKKVTASGKVMPIKPAAQWHTAYCPASFYLIDAMCAYRHIRTGSAEDPSYALDAILKKHHLGGKLKFPQAEGVSGIEWHQLMQSQYPLEYVIYNVFDCVSMEELDEVTTDLSITLPLFSGSSDFANFKSQPRRVADKLHYFCLHNKRVIGTTCSDMATELDKETIGLDGWIVTLPAHTVLDNGLQVIQEAPQLRTNIRAHVGDLDVSASYPNGEVVFNIGKSTTHKELLKIDGVKEEVQRRQGINLSAGHTNAVEVVTQLYGLPSLETLYQAFMQSTATAAPMLTQQ